VGLFFISAVKATISGKALSAPEFITSFSLQPIKTKSNDMIEIYFEYIFLNV
jgi:hypothetical protein